MRTKVCAHDKKGLRSRAYNFCAKLQRGKTYGVPVFIGTFPCYFCERRLKTRTTAEATSDGGAPPSDGRVFFPQGSIHAPSCIKCASRSVKQERAASLPIGPLVGPSLNNNPLRQNLAKGAAAYGVVRRGSSDCGALPSWRPLPSSRRGRSLRRSPPSRRGRRCGRSSQPSGLGSSTR